MDYAPIERFLIGRCGMTAQQAGWCSMDEYKLRAEGKAEEERHEWERARWQVYMMAQMHPYMKQKPKSPQEFVRFPWEIEEQGKVTVWQDSEEQTERLHDIIRNYRSRHGQDR